MIHSSHSLTHLNKEYVKACFCGANLRCRTCPQYKQLRKLPAGKEHMSVCLDYHKAWSWLSTLSVVIEHFALINNIPRALGLGSQANWRRWRCEKWTPRFDCTNPWQHKPGKHHYKKHSQCPHDLGEGAGEVKYDGEKKGATTTELKMILYFVIYQCLCGWLRSVLWVRVIVGLSRNRKGARLAAQARSPRIRSRKYVPKSHAALRELTYHYHI